MTFRSLLLAGLAMLMAVCFPLQVFSAGKAKKVSPQTSPAQAIADFGVPGIEVQSVKTLDTNKLNTKVRKAISKGENWTKDAVLVALKFAGSGLKGHTKIIEIRTPPEQRDAATITVSESGYLDDAISGERWRLWLKRTPTAPGPSSGRFGPSCATAPGRRFYSAEKCP